MLVDVITLLSFVIAIVSLGLVLWIRSEQSSQTTKIEEYTEDTNNYILLQKKKHVILQIDYARRLTVLMNLARMKIHGMNIQIKFLKKLDGNYSPESIQEQKGRRDSIRQYQNELQELMSKASLSTDIILETFNEKVQNLYNKMWKMFVYTDNLMHMGEPFFESMMRFIETGVEASDELYKILDEIIPDDQKITQEKI